MAVPQLAYWKSPQTGEPFLFLHGLLRRAGCFAPLYPALAHRWEIYSVDQAGRGDSPRLEGSAYRVTDHLPSLERFVDEVMPPDRPAVVYGHSMGAMLALALAAARPSRVRAIVLEDPPFETMGTRLPGSALDAYFHAIAPCVGRGLTARELGAVVLPGGVELRTQRDEAELRFMAGAFAMADPRVMSTVLDSTWVQGYGETALWPKLACPALLLQADAAQGGMLTDEDASAACRLSPHVSLVRLPGIGHNAHWQDAPLVARYLTAFLESLDRFRT